MSSNTLNRVMTFEWLPKKIRETAWWQKYQHLAWPGVGGVVVLIGMLIYFGRPQAEVAVVKVGKAVSAVYGTVNAEPFNQILVKSRTPGLISAIKVKVGDRVVKGQALVEIQDDTIRRQVDGARTTYNQAKEKRALGPASQSLLKSKESEVSKLKRLFDAGNIAALEYERVVNEVESLKKQVQTETIALDAEVNTAEAVLKDLSELAVQLSVTSPIDGVILDLYCNLGEYVQLQAQLARIGSSENQIVAQVNEEDIGRLQVGMKTIVRLYSYQGDNFDGKVVERLPQGENQNYKVIIKLENSPKNLLPGMTGEMNVVIGERDNTLIIPTRAIWNNNVLVVRGGFVRVASVKQGYRSIEKTEILSGLQPGDQVILSDQDQYHEGQWVRTIEKALVSAVN